MKKGTPSIAGFLTFLSLSAAPSALASSQVDVAVDLSQDLTYLQQTAENAGGKILVIDNKSKAVKEELFVDSLIAEGNRYEIESSGGKIFYLVRRRSGESVLGVFEKDANGVSVSSRIEGALDGLFIPNSLTAEPNGLLSVQSLDARTHQSKVTFLAAEKTNGRWMAKSVKEVSLASLRQAASQVSVATTVPSTYTGGKGVGFTAGLLTGIGFMYRQHFANGLGFHVGTIGWYSESELWANLGVEILKTLSQKGIWRLYTLAGASIYYQRNPNQQTWVPDPADPTLGGEYVTSTYESTDLNFGVGLGIELGKMDGVAAAFEVPLSVQFESSTDTAMHLSGIRPIPSLSLIYYFGK